MCDTAAIISRRPGRCGKSAFDPEQGAGGTGQIHRGTMVYFLLSCIKVALHLTVNEAKFSPFFELAMVKCSYL